MLVNGKRGPFIFVIGVVISITIFSFFSLYWIARYFATIDPTPEEEMEFEITWISSLYKNNVGNEWDTILLLNEKPIPNRHHIKLKKIDKLKFTAAAIEYDVRDDVGMDELILNVGDLDYLRENSYSLDIGVRENAGRYSGNIANVNFVIKVKRIVSIKDVIRHYKIF